MVTYCMYLFQVGLDSCRHDLHNMPCCPLQGSDKVFCMGLYTSLLNGDRKMDISNVESSGEETDRRVRVP